MYEPQEDSLMLSSAIKKFLEKNKAKTCIDMGAGTGIQAEIMKKYSEKIILIDINPEAIQYLEDEIQKNKEKKFTLLKSDLFKELDKIYENNIDLIAFNPPYLPRDIEEKEDIELTSGEKGVDITLRFIKESKNFLSKTGRIIFVASSLSDTNAINETLMQAKYNYKIIDKQHFFFEDILIYEAWQ